MDCDEIDLMIKIVIWLIFDHKLNFILGMKVNIEIKNQKNGFQWKENSCLKRPYWT